MTCSTAESMVNRYINHTLKTDELEEFLEHIQSCSSCYDELETYFIVHEAMQQLDEEESNVLDFQHLLESDLKKARKYVRRKKVIRLLMAIMVLLLLGILAAFFVFVVLELKQFL